MKKIMLFLKTHWCLILLLGWMIWISVVILDTKHAADHAALRASWIDATVDDIDSTVISIESDLIRISSAVSRIESDISTIEDEVTSRQSKQSIIAK